MRIAVIMTDSAGYPRRAEMVERAARAAGCDFIRVSPSDKPQPGSTVIEVPASWLPADGTPAYKQWYRAYLHYVLAADRIPPADFYWCFEADVAGTPLTWLRLLDTTADMDHDGIWTRLTNRQDPGAEKISWFHREDTPDWCEWYCLLALMRVSAAGIKVWRETAEETSNLFADLAAPSLLHRAGLKIGKINRPHHDSLYNCGTMLYNPGRSTPTPIADMKRFRHPVKYDDAV